MTLPYLNADLMFEWRLARGLRWRHSYPDLPSLIQVAISLLFVQAILGTGYWVLEWAALWQLANPK